MDKENKQPKRNNGRLAWISITVLLSMLIIYTVYHVFSGMGGVRTTPTGYAEQSVSAVLEGVIFRNEKPIPSAYSGDARYYYSDGERVSSGSTVAEIYSDKSGKDLAREIEELTYRLDILRESDYSGIVSITDIEKLNARIDQLNFEIARALARGDLVTAERMERELLISLNRKKIYDGSVDGYKDEIAELSARLDKIYASFGGASETVVAEEGGYFYHSCDGYESELAPERLETLTASELDDKLALIKETPIKENSFAGKMVYDHTWYIACPCDTELSSLLEEGKTYSVTLFAERNIDLELTLETVRTAEGERSLLVFSCTVMPEDFAYGRYQSFEIKISSYYGYRVPSDALYRIADENGEEKTGVYILSASVVRFRRVDIIVECDGYYIVAELDRTMENYKEYLDLNDQIIVSGKELYDGKVIDK